MQLDFIKVKESNKIWYGGAQEWCEQKYMRLYGCGIVGCANMLLQLEMSKSKKIVSKEDFMELVELLRRNYLLVLPRLGMNGISMMLGMNFYFYRNKLPYRARWGCLPGNLWKRVQRMLENGIPVVISIGPNFPKLWGNYRLNLYEKRGELYMVRSTTKAHYVTITAMDDDWITISSWGRKYYINKLEYLDYMKHYSNILFSNILYVKKC